MGFSPILSQHKKELKQRTSGFGPVSEGKLLEYLIQVGRGAALAVDGARKHARREISLKLGETATMDEFRAAVGQETKRFLSAAHRNTQTIGEFGTKFDTTLEVDGTAVLQTCEAFVLSIPVTQLKGVLEFFKDCFISGRSFMYRFPDHMKVTWQGSCLFF